MDRNSIADVPPLLNEAEEHLRAGRHEKAAEILLAGGLGDELLQKGCVAELLALCKKFDLASLPKGTASRLLGRLGLAYRDLGQYGEAKQCYEQGLTLARECNDPAAVCLQLVNLGDVHYYLYQLPTALEYHHQAMAMLGKDALDLDLEARNCGCLGNVLNTMGQRIEAENLYQRAASLSRQTGNLRYVGIWTGNLAGQYEKRGEDDKALAAYEEALAVARQLHDRRHESWWLGLVGSQLARRGQIEKARQAFTEALTIADQIGFRRGASRHIDGLVDLAVREGQPRVVSDLMRRVLKDPAEAANLAFVSLGLKCRLLLFDVCLTEAVLAHERERLEEAVEKCREATECLPDHFEGHYRLGQAYTALGKRHRDREALARGLESNNRAFPLTPDIFQSRFHNARAACHVYLGNIEQAHADYIESIRWEPGNTGSILSKMEVEIDLKRYAAARETYQALHGLTLSPAENVIAAAFICIARALDGLPYDEFAVPLHDSSIEVPKNLYDPTDMVPYLTRLTEDGAPPERIAEAMKIYQLLVTHCREKTEPKEPDASLPNGEGPAAGKPGKDETHGTNI